VRGDLFGSPLSGDVLGLRQLGPSGGSSKGDEIAGHHRYGAPGAFLPWRVSGGVDDHLAHGSPARVMRIATCDQKPRKRVSDPLVLRIGRVDIEMPQRGADIATAVHRPCQVPCGSPRFVSRIVDQSTVLAARLAIAKTTKPTVPT
jgi:hypothetical protein